MRIGVPPLVLIAALVAVSANVIQVEDDDVSEYIDVGMLDLGGGADVNGSEADEDEEPLVTTIDPELVIEDNSADHNPEAESRGIYPKCSRSLGEVISITT